MESQDLDAHLAGLPPVRALYTDFDGTLVGPGGSLFAAADGRPTLAAASALVDAAEAGLLVVPVSGRRRAQLQTDARLLGLRDVIAEAGSVIVRGGRVHYEWGACPEGIGASPHDVLETAGAVRALLEAFGGDLRPYAPWHAEREGSHLLHGVIDVDRADEVLRERGIGWAHVVDNGATGGWPGRAVRAYHLLPRGVSKRSAVADDLRARGLAPAEALAVGDSPQDRTMAGAVGTYVQVANGWDGGAGAAGNVFAVPGAMGEGFAQAVSSALAAKARARPAASRLRPTRP
jgi:hypothetical protein